MEFLERRRIERAVCMNEIFFGGSEDGVSFIIVPLGRFQVANTLRSLR